MAGAEDRFAVGTLLPATTQCHAVSCENDVTSVCSGTTPECRVEEAQSCEPAACDGGVCEHKPATGCACASTSPVSHALVVAFVALWGRKRRHASTRRV